MARTVDEIERWAYAQNRQPVLRLIQTFEEEVEDMAAVIQHEAETKAAADQNDEAESFRNALVDIAKIVEAMTIEARPALALLLKKIAGVNTSLDESDADEWIDQFDSLVNFYGG